MAKEVIKIKIDKETGNAQVITEGIAGKSCVDLTEDLVVQLGQVTNREFTAEYYKPEPGKDSFVTGNK